MSADGVEARVRRIAGAARAEVGRSHEVIPHTADAGLQVFGPDLRAALQAITTALAERSAEVTA